LGAHFETNDKQEPGASQRIVNEAIERHRALPALVYPTEQPIAEVTKRADDIITNGFALSRGALRLEAVDRWVPDAKRDRRWLYAANCLSPILPLLEAHGATHNHKYLELSRHVALHWIRANLIEDQKNDMRWHDMATGVRALALAYLLQEEVAAEHPDREVVALYLLAAAEHIRVLSDPKIFPKSNHGIPMMIGLAALLQLVPEAKGHAKAQQYASSRMKWLLAQQYTDEGLHIENSPSYHLLTTHSLQQVASFKLFDSIGLEKTVQRATEHFIELIHPNGNIVHIGDSDLSYELRPNPYLDFALSEGTRGTTPPTIAVGYPKAGYSIFRSPWDQKPYLDHSYLFFSAASHGTAHRHLDPFTFEWSERGVPILMDSGKYSYDYEDEWRKFFEGTRAGNAVEVDGKDYDRGKQQGFGSGLRRWGTADGLSFAEGGTKYSRLGVEHTRMIVLEMGSWLCVVDRLKARKSRTFRQWFGFHDAFDVIEKSGTFTATHQKGLNVFVQELAGDSRTEIEHGATKPRIQGWISHGYHEKEPRYSIAYRKDAQDVLFVTLFSLDAAASGTVHTDDKRLTVTFKTAGKQRGFNYAFDGKNAISALAAARGHTTM
jgi:hypothetical protein